MGKTIAALQVAEAQAGPDIAVVWADLSDEGITSPRDFWIWLLLILRRAGLGSDEDLDVADQIGIRGRVLNTARKAGPFVLVLDGYDMSTGPEVGESLVRALELLPQVRLVVSGPDLGSLTRAATRGRVPVTFLDDRALAFTPLELNHLITLRFPQWPEDCRADALRSFEMIGDGWPLAINALLNTWEENSTEPCLSATQRLLPHLVDDLLDHATGGAHCTPTLSESAEAVWLLCYFAEISADMLGGLLDLPPARAQSQLTTLAARTLRRRYDNRGEIWYSLHPIIAARLRQRGHAANMVHIKRRNSLVQALAASHPEEAQRAALAIEDWVLLESLLARHFPEELLTIDSWLMIETSQIPPLMRARVPLVTLISVMGNKQVPPARSKAHRDALRELVGNAETLNKANTPHALTGTFVAMVAARLSGDESNARRLVAKLENIIDRLPEAVARLSKVTIVSMMIQIVLTLIDLEDWDGAENKIARLRANGHGVDEYVTARLAALACVVSAIRGDMVLTKHHLQECETSLVLNPYLTRSAGDNYRVALAVYLMEAGDTASARVVVGELVARERFNEMWAIRTWVLVQLCRIDDGADAAYDLYLRRLAIAPDSISAMPTSRRLLRSLGASLQWQTGRGAQSLSQGLGDELSVAYSAISRGDLNCAIATAVAVASSAQRTGFLRRQAEALLLHAEARTAQGNGRAAEAARRHANQLCYRYGMVALPIQGLPDSSEISRHRVTPLTRSEAAVLRQISESGTASAAAETLHLSVHTVRDHLKAIYRKLDVNCRADALAVASHLGMI